jgi:putative ABC transport system permease protein|nr:MAG: multidrug ABC transporter substrate-binding protein [Pseudomonadota bacterium]
MIDEVIEDAGAASRLIYALQECLRSAVSAIRAHRMRSFLTMLGIIIGVASVICVIALVQGMSSSISQQFEGLGSTTLTVRSFTPQEDRLRGQINRLRATDVDELKLRIDGISNLTPMVPVPVGQASYRGNTASGQFIGTTASLMDVQQLYPKSGRFLTPSDDASRRRVVVLGEQVRKDLELPERPEGEFVQIGTEWFKVVGVMEPRGEVLGFNQDSFLVMPYQTALAFGTAVARPDISITFTVDDPDLVSNVKQQVIAVLRRAHGLQPDQPEDFTVESADTFINTFNTITRTITAVVAGIVGISLLVGGIGIMNIMLVSVTERTREIGIAKALGAPRRFIMLQFLIEAMVLAVIGGLIGMVLGFALAYAVAAMIANFPSPAVPWWAVAGSCLFSMLIGMVFGILPASKAAGLAPIDALRYE